jgi:hypothetical protein
MRNNYPPTPTPLVAIGQPTPVPTAISIPSKTPTPSPTATLTLEHTKPPVPTLSFTLTPKTPESETLNTTTPELTFTPPQPGLVFNFNTTNYTPNMFMGSVGDLQAELVDPDNIIYHFTVNACDLPDLVTHDYEWDQKFIAGVRNTTPPHFSGILYTDGSYGQNQESGNNFSNFSKLKWEVRSLQGEVKLQFLVGGVKWTWDNQKGIKVAAPFADTTPPETFGNAPIIAIKTIENDNEWHSYIVDLGEKDLSRIHGGFGWLLDYKSNNVKIPAPSTCSDNPPTFEFEIRNVRYEK